MTKAEQSVGKVFNFLTVLELLEKVPGKPRRVMARCVCGKIKSIAIGGIHYGNVKSCGCKKNVLKKQTNPDARIGGKATHGLSRTRLLRVWANMNSRCHDPRNKRFKDYGGRGITVCEEWKDKVAFADWARSNGYQDDLQLDRINNDAGYSPENCRFVTPRENMRNMRNSRRFEFRGEILYLRDIEERFGVNPTTFAHRVKVQGLSVEDAIFSKPRCGPKPKNAARPK